MVHKKYDTTMTPCDRLLPLPSVAESSKASLREQFASLDPIGLLQTIRVAQANLVELAARRQSGPTGDASKIEAISVFLNNLSTLWKDGEARPTHRKQPGAPRTWKTRPDPFEHARPMIQQWLHREAQVTAKDLLARLAEQVPGVYAGTSQLRTLQRRDQAWLVEATRPAKIIGAHQHAVPWMQSRRGRLRG